MDYVARALVRLSLSTRSGPVFNLAPTPEVRLPELFGWVRDYGYRVDHLPLPAWRERVARDKASADERATLAFFDLRTGSSDAVFGLGPIRCGRVLQTLEGSGIHCPPADRALLHRYLDFCVKHGLLPRP